MVLPLEWCTFNGGVGVALDLPTPTVMEQHKGFICLVWLHHCKSLHYVMLNSNHCWECHFLYFLSQSAQDAITKYHRCKGSNNRNFFIIVLEDGKPKIKVPGDFVPGESLPPVLLPATFLQCPHTAMKEREWALGLSSSSHKDTNLLTGAPLSWPHLNLITYQRSQLQISSRCGDARAST